MSSPRRTQSHTLLTGENERYGRKLRPLRAIYKMSKYDALFRPALNNLFRNIEMNKYEYSRTISTRMG